MSAFKRTNIIIDTSRTSAAYVPFAKKKVKQLSELREKTNLYTMKKVIAVGESLIRLEASEFYNKIQITTEAKPQLGLVINGIKSDPSHFRRLRHWGGESSPNILLGTTAGEPYNKNDPYHLNWSGPEYEYWNEKTIILQHPEEIDIVLRVDPFGKLPEFDITDDVISVYDVDGAKRTVNKEAVPMLFFAIDITCIPEEGTTYTNLEPEDFMTLREEFPVSAWEFYKGERVEDNIIEDKFTIPEETHTDTSYIWFDRKKKKLHLQSSDKDEKVSAKYDIQKLLKTYYPNWRQQSISSYGGLQGDMHNMYRRLRIRVIGSGRFKLWFKGRYKHPFYGYSDGKGGIFDYYYLDEDPQFEGVTLDISDTFVAGGGLWRELSIPPRAFVYNTTSITFNQIYPAITDFEFGVETIDGESANLSFDLFNLLTDHYKSAREFGAFEYKTSGSDEFTLIQKNMTLFDVYKSYTWDELLAAYPQIPTWAYDSNQFWKLLNFCASHNSEYGADDNQVKQYAMEGSTLFHADAYNCIQATVRNNPSLAWRLNDGDGNVVYPNLFRYHERIYMVNTDGRTIGEILSHKKSDKLYALRYDNLRTYCDIYTVDEQIPLSITEYSYNIAYKDNTTKTLTHNGYSVAGLTKEPDLSFISPNKHAPYKTLPMVAIENAHKTAGALPYSELPLGVDYFIKAEAEGVVDYEDERIKLLNEIEHLCSSSWTKDYAYYYPQKTPRTSSGWNVYPQTIEDSFFVKIIEFSNVSQNSALTIPQASTSGLTNGFCVFTLQRKYMLIQLELFASELTAEEHGNWKPAANQKKVYSQSFYLLDSNGYEVSPTVFNIWGTTDCRDGIVLDESQIGYRIRGGALTPKYNI